MIEQLEDSPLHSVAHHVLPTTGFRMNVLPGHGEDFHEHAFRKPMFSHDAHRLLFARARQFEMSILVDRD